MRASFEEWSEAIERLADIAILIGNEARDFLKEAQYKSETTGAATQESLDQVIEKYRK